MADALIANEVESIGEQEMAKAVIAEYYQDLQFLKQSAYEYLGVVRQVRPQLQYFTQLLKRQSSIRKTTAEFAVIEEYIQNKKKVQSFLIQDIPKTLYAASFKFQNALNNFLGQQVKMVFVVEGSTGPELYEITSEDILKFDYSSSNQLTARYRVTMEDLGQSLKKLEITEGDLHFSLTGLKSAYAEVLIRYRISRSEGQRRLFWQPGGVWKEMNISAEGDINEAYAAFVLLNKVSPKFNRDLEWNIDDFAQGIAEVDNMSGLLKGDVSVGNIEYGIKSAGASTLGLKQMEKLAEQILKENFDQNSLAKVQAKMIARAKTRNKIQNLVNRVSDSLIARIVPKKN